MRAIFLMMQDKRGISVLAMQRLLGLSSYGTTWTMALKIRRALQDRDSRYKIKDVIEIDGGYFGRKATQNQESVFIAVERKRWIDSRGRAQLKTGFAKVMLDSELQESRKGADKFVSENIKEGSTIIADGRRVYENHPNAKLVQVESSTETLPLVHRFISNAKRWILGTHHGVKKNHKYLGYYMAEYTYRFNRRHDPNSLFSRAFYACMHTTPITIPALCR
jgi:hypothetical protein